MNFRSLKFTIIIITKNYFFFFVNSFTHAAAFKIVAFGIVTNAYQEAAIPSFEYARPSTYNSHYYLELWSFIFSCLIFSFFLGTAYVLNTLSWVLDVLTTFGVLITGLAAEAGHAWAAGHRAYRPIEG